MAVALNNVTRMSQAETNADGGNWDKWATAQNPANEVDFVYQLGTNSQALSNKVSATTGGVEFTATTAVDYSTTARTVLTLVNVTTYGLINTAVHLGTSYQIGSTDDANDVIDYYLHGSFNDYPPKGGWLIVAIDPNEVAYKDLVTGTPSLTAVDYYSWRAAITASAKAENVVMDALCYMNSDGGGLIWTGTGGSFQDFIDYDEGTIANRYGIVYTEQDALIITGTLTIGSGTATTFTDTGKVLFWTESLTAAGFNALDIDLSNATNSVSISDCFMQGKGRGFAKDFFDTTADIDATNDVITLDTAKDWQDLDYIVYSKEGGVGNIGLTVATDYWIRWDAANSGWAVYASRANAAADTSRLNLSTVASENHSFQKDPDTRPDITVTSTTGVGATIDGCVIDNFRNITLNADCTFTDNKLTNTGYVEVGREPGPGWRVGWNHHHQGRCRAPRHRDGTDFAVDHDDPGLDHLWVQCLQRSERLHHPRQAHQRYCHHQHAGWLRELLVQDRWCDGGGTELGRPDGHGQGHRWHGAGRCARGDLHDAGWYRADERGYRRWWYCYPAVQLYNNYTSDQAIRIEIRESPNSPSGRYVPAQRTGTIEDTGFTLTVVLEDENIAQVV
jgi:hypothetical protein